MRLRANLKFLKLKVFPLFYLNSAKSYIWTAELITLNSGIKHEPRTGQSIKAEIKGAFNVLYCFYGSLFCLEYGHINKPHN